MSTYDITVSGGSSVRLPTAGKYCDRDIVVTAEGGDIDALITRSITEIDSEVTVVGYYAFTNCSSLVKVNLPNVITVSGYGFQACTSLRNVTLPKTTGINGYGFYNCTSLENVDIPNIRSVGNYAFRKCSSLTKVNLYQTYTINVYAFYECTNLETVILCKTDKPCTLSATNCLQNTKIANGTGYIYVPKSLIDSYKSATNWSTYAAQFRAIEDYPDICGG